MCRNLLHLASIKTMKKDNNKRFRIPLGSYNSKAKEERDMKKMKLLMIGNSFSEDTSSFASEIAAKMGLTLDICNMYIGGCTIDTHLAKIKSNEPAYGMQLCHDGKWSFNPGRTFDDGLLRDEYDVITLQQASGFSGIPSSYDGYLQELLEYTKSKSRNKNAEYWWHLTWAYSVGSPHCDFPKYGCDQSKMYQAIISCYQSKVRPLGLEKIIPAGTAIQNARQIFSESKLSRDLFHLSYDFGRFLASLTLVESLFGVDPAPYNLSCPTGEEDERLAKLIAKKAIESPLSVSKINQ